MQEFIALAARQLGVDAQTTQSATSSLLGYIQREVGGADATEFLRALPGDATALANQGQAAGEGAGGGLGGLVKNLAGSFGDRAAGLAGAAGLAAQLKESGLALDQLGPFAELFTNFARENAGEGLVERVLGQVPQLRQLLG